MGEIIPFKKKTLTEKHKGNTLCREGHHAWRLDKERQFDVKKGRLLNVYHCKRCGINKNTLN